MFAQCVYKNLSSLQGLDNETAVWSPSVPFDVFELDRKTERRLIIEDLMSDRPLTLNLSVVGTHYCAVPADVLGHLLVGAVEEKDRVVAWHVAPRDG